MNSGISSPPTKLTPPSLLFPQTTYSSYTYQCDLIHTYLYTYSIHLLPCIYATLLNTVTKHIPCHTYTRFKWLYLLEAIYITAFLHHSFVSTYPQLTNDHLNAFIILTIQTLYTMIEQPHNSDKNLLSQPPPICTYTLPL